MATNNVRWIENIESGAPEPLIRLGLFQAGSTQAIKRGELLELTGDGNTAFVPLDSDFQMDGHIAIANEEIKDGDRAGYYEIIIPRPGDVFEFALAAASALVAGTALYYSSSEAVTASAGANVLGWAVGFENYPQKQRHLTDDAAGDSGTTIANTSYARMTIARCASYFTKLQGQGNMLNLGDGGGFSGPIFNPTTTELEWDIDGTLTGSLGADGVWTDEVS